jgi:hypothetical protein
MSKLSLTVGSAKVDAEEFAGEKRKSLLLQMLDRISWTRKRSTLALLERLGSLL